MLNTALKRSGLSLMLALPLLAAGCGGQGGGWQMPPAIVETHLATQEPWTVRYSTSGMLEANNKVDLNTETPGTITGILVHEGDSVGRGQVLMRLKADKQLAQVQQSAAGIEVSEGGLAQQKADIQQAKARLDSATVRKNFAQSEYQRYEKLYNDQFISQLELDQKRNNYDVALAAWQEAQQAVSSSRARYEQAASNVSQARSTYRYNLAMAGDTVIRAPFTGKVGQKYVDAGDYVAPTEKLITLVDSSLFKIQFSVPERYLREIQAGLPVTVKFEGLGNEAFAGKVNFIDPVVDSGAHTIMVKAILPGGGPLRHGLFGTVALALGTIPNAVVVPEEALVPQGEKTFVYVVKPEVPALPAADKSDKKAAVAKAAGSGAAVPTAHLREVVVGHREEGRVQIESGLAAGEEVITSGLQKVTDGAQVNVQNGPPAPNGAASTPNSSSGKGH